MLKELVVCCAGVAMLSGCGVALDNGKWQPLKANQVSYSSVVKQQSFAESYCNIESSNENRDECLTTYVERRRYYSYLNEENAYKEGTPASTGPLGIIATVKVDDALLYSASDLDTDEIKPAIITDFAIHF